MISRGRLARGWIRAVALLVPADRREAWREEWLGELHALTTRPGARPGPLAFARGALRHALWLRARGASAGGIALDVRHGVRALGRRPGFLLASVTVLALGLGANTALFSLLNGVLLKPPAGVERPGELVQLVQETRGREGVSGFSWPNLQLLRETGEFAFQGVEGFSRHLFVVGEGEEARSVRGHFVTGGLFPLLGVRAEVGRLLQPSDDVAVGAHPVVVLSRDFWIREWGEDPEVVGRTLVLDGAPYTVVGVAPAGFTGIHTNAPPPELFVPSLMHPELRGGSVGDTWRWSWLDGVARRAGGVAEEEARDAEALLTGALRAAHEDNDGRSVRVLPGVGPEPWAVAEARRLGSLLTALVVLVFGMTCVAVANLFSSRAVARVEELAIRRTLGAGRGRLIRHLVVEAVLVAGCALVLALPVAFLAPDLVPALAPLPVHASLHPDARVFLFLAGCGALAAGLVGVLPAWLATRRDPAVAIRGGTATSPARGGRLRDGLVVLQLALSLALLTGGVLLARSLVEGVRADPGFRSEGLRVVFLDLPDGEERPEEGLHLRLLQAVEGRPEVRSATLASQAPMAGGQSRGSVRLAAGATELEVEQVAVAPDWFRTYGVPLLAGRPPAEGEAVVSAGLARRLFPGGEALGETLEAGGTFRIVGIAGDVRMRSLREPPHPAVYLPLSSAWPGRITLTVALHPGAMVPPRVLLDWVREVDPRLDGWTAELRARVLAGLDDARATAVLLAAFAGVALVLAAVGLGGLVGERTRARTREFGVRLALGARSSELRRLAVRGVLPLVGLGVLLGIPLALALGSVLGGLLFRVGSSDPVALGGAALLLGGLALLAAWAPAARAGRVDPRESLRS